MNIRHTNRPPVALTIAGLDPSGGAGIIADVKTFTAFGCFATAAVTSLTFQNTLGVYGAAHQTGDAVRAQVLPVVEDFQVAGVKTGMLPTREIIQEVARLFRETKLLPAPVVDPVIRSTSGYDLIDDAALDTLVRELFPLARLVTPNIPEAERITQRRITNEEEMRAAARLLRETGARAVLIKGGHLTGDALDVLDDGGCVKVFRGARIETNSTHGTGCTLAAAIAACLANQLDLETAVDAAKRFVTDALRHTSQLGHGHSPINLSVRVKLPEKQNI
ncbi:MAG: bifunctional hydroxymethylpyrimidine kinase/phosphomethylpyrimidine kinase [Pyrinomonadaceae bacterium]